MEKKSQSGFSLLELIVAVFILTVGILGVQALIRENLVLVFHSKNRLTAAYLAQEGIEIVRNIRDTNWVRLRAHPALLIHWDDEIFCCPRLSCDCEADYNDLRLELWQGRPLNLDDKGFYSYDVTNNPTNFKRKITVTSRPATPHQLQDQLQVTVEVEWTERGRSYSIVVLGNLYNWVD